MIVTVEVTNGVDTFLPETSTSKINVSSNSTTLSSITSNGISKDVTSEEITLVKLTGWKSSFTGYRNNKNRK